MSLEATMNKKYRIFQLVDIFESISKKHVFFGNRIPVLALFLLENGRFLLKNPPKMQGTAPRRLQIIFRLPGNMLRQVGVHETSSAVIKQLKTL